MSPLRSGNATVDGSVNPLMAVDTTTIDGLYDLDVTEGDMAAIGADGVAVTADRALDEGLALGDTVTFTFADGSEAALAVRAIFAADVPADGDWILDVTTLEAHSADQFDRMLFVSIDDGVAAEEARTAIESAMADWPNAAIQDQAEFKESVTSEIDMMLNLIYGLLALAVLISLIGIANTLALSVHERTRELGLLRAVGMHRRQLKRAVRWEALLISGMGATLGAVLAVGGAYGIVEALESEGVTQLVVPGPRLAVIVALAGLAGVVAATAPARRASRLDVLEALAAD
jgi:putative ABC transport system permease protein